MNKKYTRIAQVGRIQIKHKLFYWVPILSIFGVSCSPFGFFGKKNDPSVVNLKNYRKVNTACSKMNLKSAQMDVPTVRSLVSCLNAEGALDKVQILLNQLSDKQVEPMVQLMNQYLLGDKKRLYEIEQTYRSFVKQNIHQDAFKLLGEVLENRELIASSLILMKSGFYQTSARLPLTAHLQAESEPSPRPLPSPVPSSGPSAGPSSSPSGSPGSPPPGAVLATPNKKILKALEILAKKLDDNSFRNTLDISLLTAKAPSFKSLETHLLAPRHAGETEKDRDLKNLELITQLSNYLKEEHTFGCGEDTPRRQEKLGHELTALVKSRRVFPVLDQVLGKTESEITSKAPQLVRVTTGLTQAPVNSTPALSILAASPANATLMDALGNAFHDLGGEVKCMKGAKAIPDATRYLINELVEYHQPSQAHHYIGYEAPLTLMSLKPFCSFPENLQRHYESMYALAESGVAEPMVELLSEFYQVTSETGICPKPAANSTEPYRPWIDFVSHVLADPGIHHFTPLLGDMVGRNILPDLLLLSTVTGDQDREQINDALLFMMEPRKELDDQSVLEVFTDASGHIAPKDFLRLMKSAAVFLQRENGGFLEQILTTTRRIHHVNNVTPFLGLIRDIGSQATQQVALFETLFAVVDHHEAEFLDSLEQLSSLAKNGELNSLVGSVVNLFSKFAQEGKALTQVKETQEPLFSKKSRHQLKGLSSLAIQPAERIHADCRGLNLDFSLANVSDADFPQELEKFLACKNRDGAYSDLAQTLTDLNRHPIQGGKTFLAYQIEELSAFMGRFDSESNKFMVDQWMKAFPYKGQQYCTNRGRASGEGKIDPAPRESAVPRDNRVVRLLNAVPFWVTGNSSVMSARLLRKNSP